MSLLFGDRATFAIELEIPADQPDPFSGLCPMVHLTYWIAGREIGDPELATYAGYAEDGLRHHLADRGHRRDDGLYALPASELIALLDSCYNDPALAERATTERWSAHSIGRPLDRSEYLEDLQTGWTVHLVEDERTGRVLAYRRAAPAEVIEGRILPGEVDGALAAAWNAMQALLEPDPQTD
ncbi:MAG: hypothetical protein REJ23_02510 [Brevundimonas sp.]|nr:hypothetical protein [Brevundimonas sp.]